MDEDDCETGIDEELVKLASMHDKERNALEHFLFHSKNAPETEVSHLWAAIVRLLLLARSLHSQNISLEIKVSGYLRDKKKQTHSMVAMLLVAVGIIGVLTFNDFRITVEPYDNSVIAIKTSWWGLVSKERQIKWMRPSGYDLHGWMTKDANGEWYLYIREDNSDPPYE
jgi:hypothetical protein